MNKPSYKELERQIKAQEETIKHLNKDHTTDSPVFGY